MKSYLVMIDSDYCDGQAYIDNPEGEFGGDGYVELSSTYPICIGTYRGESPAEAIEHAAGDLDCDEAILIATEISEPSL